MKRTIFLRFFFSFRCLMFYTFIEVRCLHMQKVCLQTVWGSPDDDVMALKATEWSTDTSEFIEGTPGDVLRGHTSKHPAYFFEMLRSTMLIFTVQCFLVSHFQLYEVMCFSWRCKSGSVSSHFLSVQKAIATSALEQLFGEQDAANTFLPNTV